MTYTFTTEPIKRDAGEGAINAAIEASAHGKTKKDPPDEQNRPVIEAAKRAVHGIVSVLDGDVTGYTITVSGHHATSRTKQSFSVSVEAHDYEAPDE